MLTFRSYVMTVLCPSLPLSVFHICTPSYFPFLLSSFAHNLTAVLYPQGTKHLLICIFNFVMYQYCTSSFFLFCFTIHTLWCTNILGMTLQTWVVNQHFKEYSISLFYVAAARTEHCTWVDCLVFQRRGKLCSYKSDLLHDWLVVVFLQTASMLSILTLLTFLLCFSLIDVRLEISFITNKQNGRMIILIGSLAQSLHFTWIVCNLCHFFGKGIMFSYRKRNSLRMKMMKKHMLWSNDRLNLNPFERFRTNILDSTFHHHHQKHL